MDLDPRLVVLTEAPTMLPLRSIQTYDLLSPALSPIRMRDQLWDQLWDQLATTESDRDVLSRSCMPTTPGLKAIPESRRADSNRGPLHYE